MKSRKAKGAKAINFVQLTNSIVINSEEELDEYRMKLTQNNNSPGKKSNGSMGQSIKLKSKVFPEHSSGQSSRRSSNVHTLNRSRNSKLEKENENKDG